MVVLSLPLAGWTWDVADGERIVTVTTGTLWIEEEMEEEPDGDEEDIRIQVDSSER